MKKILIISSTVIFFVCLIGLLAIRVFGLNHQLPQSFFFSDLQNRVPLINSLSGGQPVSGFVSTQLNGVTFEVVSKIPEYKITSQTIDKKQLEVSLTNLGLNNLNQKKFIQYTARNGGGFDNRIRTADFKTIRVTFLPANLLPSAADYSNTMKFPLVHLLTEELHGRTANAFFNGVVSGDVFDVTVYIDPIAASQFALNASQYLNSSFLKSLYFNFNNQEYKSWQSPSVTFEENLKDLFHPVFEITFTKPTSQLPNKGKSFISLLKDLFISQVYAQSCGTALCGTATQATTGTCPSTTTGSCSISGISCSINANCLPYGGVCNLQTTPGGACMTSAACPGNGACTGAVQYSCNINSSGSCSMAYWNSTLMCQPQCGSCSSGGCGAPSCTWGAWSTCTATCGGGTQTRTDNCNNSQVQACNTQACTCTFGGWSACNSATCGTQTQSDNCGHTNTQQCGPSCGCTPNWGAWGACSATCGGGTQTRSDGCGNTQSQACNTQSCSCTPSCPTSCGQADGCGSFCSNAGTLTPTTPTGLSPANGGVVTSATNQATVSWSAATNATAYEVQFFPSGTSGSPALVFNSQNVAAANANTYWKTLAGSTALATGDTIEYDVNLATNTTLIGGIDIRFTDSTYARNLGFTDQAGSGIANGVAPALAYNQWYHRIITVPAAANGKIINWVDLVNENDTAISTTAYFNNLVIKTAGVTKATIYTNAQGNPTYNTLDFSSNAANSGNAQYQDQGCTVANSHCPNPTSSTSYVFTGDAGVHSYTWRVRAINASSCGTTFGPWTTSTSFSFGGNITGNFYLDNTNTATVNAVTGLCQAGVTPSMNAPAGSTIQATWSGNPVAGNITNSTYTISNVGYAVNTAVALSLTSMSGYRCSCPTNCSYSGLSAPIAGVNFFLNPAPLGWWQTSNGFVYAQSTSGVAVQTQIPTSCASSGTCTAALSTYDSVNNTQSDSTTLTGGGSVVSAADVATPLAYLNQSGTNTHAEGVALNGPREDYTYFSQLYGMSTSSTVDFTGTQPTTAPTNGNAYYANGNITISTPWTLNTADSMVIFVNGNLTITQPILVAKGAFLAFIVNGNITFDKSLGSNSSNTPSIAGVYVANGQIISQSNSPGDDLKLVGEGTFVGWSGITLQRNFNNANSARGFTEPIESFRFRPDFMLTVPTKMTKPLFVWQETN